MAIEMVVAAAQKTFDEENVRLLPGVSIMRPKRSKRAIPPALEVGVVIKSGHLKDEQLCLRTGRVIGYAMATGYAHLYGRTNRVVIPTNDIQVESASHNLYRFILPLKDVTEERKIA